MGKITRFDHSQHENFRKKPKLGRYDRIKRELETRDNDPNKLFVDVLNGQKLAGKVGFVDLFSGAGGITCGLKQAGYEPKISVEMVEVASQTHKRNFPTCEHFCGDISEFKIHEMLSKGQLEDVHLVVGGPPCQGFSVAGKRDPNDPRNKLFRQFIRVVDEVRPYYIVMENVPGILTMQKGAVKDAIIETFREIGYDNVSVAVLESAEYGIPQVRTRAFFIANRLGLPNPFPKPMFKSSEFSSIESAINDLAETGPIPEINHEWTKHSKDFIERISKVPPGGSLYETFADAFKRQYMGLPSMTIKENHGGSHIHPYLNRCISAREMARLQSFPDSFIFEGSMKKAMWQIGNAVPPRLAEIVGRTLIPMINHAVYGKPLPATYQKAIDDQRAFDLLGNAGGS